MPGLRTFPRLLPIQAEGAGFIPVGARRLAHLEFGPLQDDVSDGPGMASA